MVSLRSPLLLAALAGASAASLLAAEPHTAPAPAAVRGDDGNGGDAAAKKPTAKKGRVEYFTHDAELLKTKLDIGVYLPGGYEESTERYPVLYFLHGLWGTSRKWEERGTAATLDALIAEGKVPPMIVVCPDGQNAMWIDALEVESPWNEFLASELVTLIDGKYRTKAARESRGVNGDSMGGYGAFNLAFKHPDVFASVSTHEAMLYPVDPEKLPDRIKQFAQQWKPVYGWPIDVKHWKEWSPLEQAATLPVETLSKLAIYFDCGDQDRFGFNTTNQELHELLDKRKVAHEWFLRSGGHGRDFFSEYVVESLQFHGKAFRGATPRNAADTNAAAPAKAPAKQ